MKLKYVVGVLLCSTAISGSAYADGWSGAYLGLQGGFANLPSVTDNGGSVFQDATLSGLLFGIDGGFDHQLPNNIVLGFTGDMSFANVTGNGALYGVGSGPFTLTLNSLGRAQIRAGTAFGTNNENLLYIAGGLAFGNVTRSGSVTGGTNTHVGWVASAGFEHKISPSASLRAEASYVDLGQKSFSSGETVKLGGLLATLGVNFHF